MKHFGLDIYWYRGISTFWVKNSWRFYLLNCFKYFEIYIFKKNQTKKIELYQNDLIFTKMCVLYQVTKRLGIHKRFQVLRCANTLKLYTSKKTLLSKNRFCFFLLIFWYSKNPPSFRMPRLWHWVFIYNFSSDLSISNLICLTKKLSWLHWKVEQYAWQIIFFK